MPITTGSLFTLSNKKSSDSADWMNEKAGRGNQPTAFVDFSEVKRRMEVLSSCGCVVGMVDQFDDEEIRLIHKDVVNGPAHFIPTGWVAWISERIHLHTDIFETKVRWRSEGAIP